MHQVRGIGFASFQSMEHRKGARDPVDIVTTSLDAGPAAVRTAVVLLSNDERRRAARFACDHARRRFIMARARLRQLVGARLGVPPGSIEFAYGAAGKPRLAAGFGDADLRFNLSHCGALAAFAIAEGRDIGIDIEAVRPLPDADAIARLVFSPREQDAYRALDGRHRPLGFFNCWTRKEAFVKAIGDGLRHPLDRFDVSLVPGEPARLLRVGSTPGSRSGWALHAFVPGPGLIGAIAVRTSAPASDTTIRPPATRPAGPTPP